MYKQILVPIDYSNKDFWRRALPLAVEEAKLHGAKLSAGTGGPELIALPNLPADYGTGAKQHARDTVAESIKEVGAEIALSVR